MPTDLLTGASPAVVRPAPRAWALPRPLRALAPELGLLAVATAWMAYVAHAEPQLAAKLRAAPWGLMTGAVTFLAQWVWPVALLLAVRAWWWLRRADPDASPATLAARWWATWGRDAVGPLRLAHAALAVSALTLVQFGVAAWKSTIGRSGFRWDATFAAWDAALHPGPNARDWLSPALAHPAVTGALDWLYWPAWPAAMLATALGICVLRPGPVRTRALVVYGAIWLGLGAGLARAFASAGPCFWPAITTPGAPFVALSGMEHAPTALRLQVLLWADDRAHAHTVGIAAMPSVHVAIAVLAACLLWRTRARWLGVAWAVVIQVGSVWLGWHWAVDGYVSAVVVVGLWCGIGWWQNQAQVAAQPMQRGGERRRPAAGIASRST